VSTLRVGGRLIGDGEPVFVIAEAGVNHNGDLERAIELVDAAARSGADAVKFQTFDPDAIATRTAPLAQYQKLHQEAPQADQVSMLQELRLDDDALRTVARECASQGIIFLSTPFDSRSADVLEGLGVPAFKVGSGELTNLPFLDDLASRGRPLLVSTGMATMSEVHASVDVIRARQSASFALFHCVSSYPAPPEEVNLRAMDALREAFDVPVGFSDHTLGVDVSIAAVARGATMLERHLTMDRGLPGPDHQASLEPHDLADLIKRLRTLEVALGDGVKRPQPSELETMQVARRSIVAARAMKPGDQIDEEALAIKRPGGGLPPGRLPSVIGIRLARAIDVDEALTEAHLEQGPQRP
jgi:N,N'-diacetyllegionaminate synthase